ncbi:MAG: Fic family protein, partial [Candidatus Peregrinibacteria bacterium]|nr:Fic family protein [Candidatus Peregrinibacteria bacterium]
MLLRKNLQTFLADKLRQLNKKRPLSSAVAQQLRERFEVEMTYNSNAIEGNTLTLKETYWVIQQGITVKGKPLKDHLEAKSHKEALDFLYELVDKGKRATISEHLIKSIHSIILEDIDRDIAGTYRKTDVFIMGSDHKPPSPLEVSAKMSELMNWSKKNHNKMDTVEFTSL